MIKDGFIIITACIIGILGLYLNIRNISLTLHGQTAILVIPFFTAGYYLKLLNKDIFKILKIYIFIPVCFILYYLAYYLGFYIDLSVNKIVNVYLFYFISLIGIYFCLYTSKIIYNIRYIKSYFSLLGTYSFEVMAFHFLIFKIIDYIYAHITKINNPFIYGIFPYAFKNLWWCYIILGVSVPAILFYLLDIGKNKIKKDILVAIRSNLNKITAL